MSANFRNFTLEGCAFRLTAHLDAAGRTVYELEFKEEGAPLSANGLRGVIRAIREDLFESDLLYLFEPEGAFAAPAIQNFETTWNGKKKGESADDQPPEGA